MYACMVSATRLDAFGTARRDLFILVGPISMRPPTSVSASDTSTPRTS
jgi:hypothetical protein